MASTKAIGTKLGPILEVDPDSEGVKGLGFFAPPPRGFSIQMGEKSLPVEFYYERLGNVCFRCGFLDHLEEDCFLAYYPKTDNGKKNWLKDMRATPPV